MPTPSITSYRGACIENTYRAHIAVVDSTGACLMPFRQTLARSAAKPAQALAVLQTGALEKFALTEADLALMCASHSSEDRHIERTRSMLSRIGAQESDMRCGGHAPASDDVYRRWIRQGFEPTAACSNCSGKHVGMLAAAQAMGTPMANYHQPDHPVQLAVKRVVAEVCGLPADAVGWAIDGCNLPTPAFPLDKLAGLYCQLAHATDTSPPNTALARIYHAMTTYPELVGGEGRLCTALMQSFGTSLVAKAGAEACYGIGVRASDTTRQLGAHGALGIAVKIEDGNVQVLQATVCEVLQQLGIGTEEQRHALESFHHPKIVNTMQVEVGGYAFGFELERG